ncbi:MobA/MobL family protein [Rhodanobacter sp. PCA2]|uniref:MobA/MobL family protein n=1 Tax=Rhodanobacter sp. PCA2 TaxID=2006117 RepID=UPI0015E69692|nr:MobA/MobL family protein [Rhodanobacter sp. PCA2]MBA2079173.1 hypothetical protein [Rhodanobacter sp. PCA2]
MALHARPHLETHFRKAGHSAIAGVAYRLGLRLYDRRTGEWHDYRRRKIGEEIVRALTIAPDDAPVWATDPEELWNRVEAAEKRKDSQVARDYRIPIPFGLTDQQAGDLAEDMARFIATELHTAVSLGLHRDAEIDALGNIKPPDKQGFHAHLYFPTRRLEDIQGEDGASNWGLGAKLVLLSNKNTSGAFVERLNEHWASLSNRYTAANGLPADYTHLSYARQDLPITPQPTLGAAVTAMERRGFFTRRGDALRGDIVIPAKVYEAAHAVVLDEQHRRAMEDVARETAREARPEPETAAPGEIIPPPTVAPVVLMPLLDGEPGSLVARFRAAAPIPETPEGHQVLARVLRWVQVIQRVLGALAELADRFRVHEEDRGRRMAAKLDTDCQLDGARAMRAATRQRLTDWEDAHPLLMFLAKKATNEEGKPAAWRTLRNALEVQERRVRELKGTKGRHQTYLDGLALEGSEIQQQEEQQTGQLKETLVEVQALAPDLLPMLMSVTNDEEKQFLVAVVPEAVKLDGANFPLEPPALVPQPVVALRPRRLV